jgi:hypothetical protein
MSEMTETEIITQLNVIDAEIAKIAATLGTVGAAGVNFVDYTMGNKSVDGSTRMTQLIEARKMYQGMLDSTPKMIIRSHGYGYEQGTGEPTFDEIGDE